MNRMDRMGEERRGSGSLLTPAATAGMGDETGRLNPAHSRPMGEGEDEDRMNRMGKERRGSWSLLTPAATAGMGDAAGRLNPAHSHPIGKD